jgi:hypothetical protein
MRRGVVGGAQIGVQRQGDGREVYSASDRSPVAGWPVTVGLLSNDDVS